MTFLNLPDVVGRCPLVLLDVDGVLCDFVGSLLEAINAYTNMEFQREDITGWDVAESLRIPKKTLNEVYKRSISLPGWCKRLQPYPGAVDGFRRLKEVAEVHIVTTPFASSDFWLQERVEWLHTHFKVKPEEITFTSRKELVKGDYLVDDKVETCVKWGGKIRARQERAILWSTPHNKLPVDAGCYRRAWSWTDVIGHIEACQQDAYR